MRVDSKSALVVVADSVTMEQKDHRGAMGLDCLVRCLNSTLRQYLEKELTRYSVYQSMLLPFYIPPRISLCTKQQRRLECFAVVQ
jgi:hypothetical protein